MMRHRHDRGTLVNRYLSILCIVGALVACDESEPLSPADAAMGDAASPDVGPDTGPDPDAAPEGYLNSPTH